MPPIAADAPNVVWAIDKSAYTRLLAGLDAEAWVDRIDRCLVRISTVTRLEIGYTFRTGEQARIEPTAPPLTMMPVEYLTRPSRTAPSKCRCCSPIVGQHHALAIPDLLVATTAEIANLTVLALDKGFDLIASTTGQPVERLRL